MRWLRNFGRPVISCWIASWKWWPGMPSWYDRVRILVISNCGPRSGTQNTPGRLPSGAGKV